MVLENPATVVRDTVELNFLAVIKRHNLFVFKLLFIFKFKEFQIGHKQKYYLSLNFQSTWLLWF